MYFTNLHVLWTTGKYQATGRYISHWLITDWCGLYRLPRNMVHAVDHSWKQSAQQKLVLFSALLTSEVLVVPKILQTQIPCADLSLNKDDTNWRLVHEQGRRRTALLSGSFTGLVTWCKRAASASWNHQHLHLALAAGCLIWQSSSGSRNFRGFISTASISLGLCSKKFLVSSFIPGYLFH